MAPIDDIFDAGWLRDIYPKAVNGSPALRRRYQVLTASGPLPSDRLMSRYVRIWRAQRAAWEAYLDAAQACSLIDDDVRGRLRDADDVNFRGAMAECCACWLFAGLLGHKTTPRPQGRELKNLDMRVEANGTAFGVEVKAPAREPPVSGAWFRDDADLLIEVLKKANSQFTDNSANALVLVPSLRTPISLEREQLVRAYIGEPAVTWSVPISGDGEPTEPRSTFLPNGKFVKLHRRPGHPNPLPDATRVSAIVSVEERLVEKAAYRSRFTRQQIANAAGDRDTLQTVMWEGFQARYATDNPTWIEHEVLVLHNPYAKNPLDEGIFDAYPQLIPRDGFMFWTDEPPDGAEKVT